MVPVEAFYRIDTVATNQGIFVDWNEVKTTGPGATESAAINGAIRFSIQRADADGNMTGVARRVHVSLGSGAWLAQ